MRTLPILGMALVLGAATISLAQERPRAGISVFIDENYRGLGATIRRDVPNLRPLGLNDRISSLRVAPGEQWEICERANYQGRCIVVSGDDPDLDDSDWANVISSMRRVPTTSTAPPRANAPPAASSTPAGPEPFLVLHERTGYRGARTTYRDEVADLGENDDRAQSVTIRGGAWELFEGPRFTGRRVMVRENTPNLESYGMRNRVSSLRPVRVRSGGTDVAITPPPRNVPPPPPNEPTIILHDQTNYRGPHVSYRGEAGDLGEHDDRARSVTVRGGVWELFEGPRFTGRHVTVRESVPNLEVHALRGRVSSLRPFVPRPVESELANNRWRPIEVIGAPVMVGRPGSEPWIELDPKAQRFTGSGGCNRITGTFRANGNSLNFDRAAGTRMACPDMLGEEAILDALERTASYRVQGRFLDFMDADSVTVMRLEERNL
jgi:heat shock protein HslJ